MLREILLGMAVGESLQVEGLTGVDAPEVCAFVLPTGAWQIRWQPVECRLLVRRRR